jgi:hypothetical protein
MQWPGSTSAWNYLDWFNQERRDMGFPITTTTGGICFAFPDVCNTQVGPATVPLPYPNIGQLSDAQDTSTKAGDQGAVEVGGKPVVLADQSKIQTSTGDEAGSIGGITSGVTKGEVKFTRGSATVQIHGKAVVRMFDPTTQNKGNAVGTVLGGVPNVLVGG